MMIRRRRDQLERDLALIKLGHARSYLAELHLLLEEMEPMLSDKQWASLKRIFIAARESYAGNNQVMSDYLGISPTAVGRFTQRTYKPYAHYARPVAEGLVRLFENFADQFKDEEGSIMPPGWKKIPPSDELAQQLKGALEDLYDCIRESNSLLRVGVLTRSGRDELLLQIQLVIQLLDTKLVELGALMSLSRNLHELDRRSDGVQSAVAASASEVGENISSFVSVLLS